MQAKLLREPNLIFETTMLLFNSRTGASSRELKETIQKKFAIDRNVLDSCFDAIIDMSEYVVNNVKADEDLLDFLFGRHSSMKGCFAFYLIHDVCRVADHDLAAGLAALREQSKALFFVNLSSLLIAEFAPDDYTGVITNYAELFAFIENLPLPADEKFELCRLYNNFEEYRELLAGVLESAAKLYMQKYDSVKHYIGWFSAAVAEPLAQSGASYIESNYGIKISPSADEIYLQPSIAMCSGTRYLMSFTSEKVVDFLYVGVLYEPLREITDVSTVDDRICRALRTMGDDRKFEILKLLAEGTKYGMELASLLELSTATVSHHMALLLEAGFVSIRRESNRVYYELNRKKVRDFLDELRIALIGQ